MFAGVKSSHFSIESAYKQVTLAKKAIMRKSSSNYCSYEMLKPMGYFKVQHPNPDTL